MTKLELPQKWKCEARRTEWVGGALCMKLMCNRDESRGYYVYNRATEYAIPTCSDVRLRHTCIRSSYMDVAGWSSLYPPEGMGIFAVVLSVFLSS